MGQRSTFWLQLRKKYILPLLASSILSHWLVSPTLFIVRINVFGWDGEEQPDRDILACEYSPLAILIVVLGVVLSLIVLLWQVGQHMPSEYQRVGQTVWLSPLHVTTVTIVAWKPLASRSSDHNGRDEFAGPL